MWKKFGVPKCVQGQEWVLARDALAAGAQAVSPGAQRDKLGTQHRSGSQHSCTQSAAPSAGTLRELGWDGCCVQSCVHTQPVPVSQITPFQGLLLPPQPQARQEQPCPCSLMMPLISSTDNPRGRQGKGTGDSSDCMGWNPAPAWAEPPQRASRITFSILVYPLRSLGISDSTLWGCWVSGFTHPHSAVPNLHWHPALNLTLQEPQLGLNSLQRPRSEAWGGLWWTGCSGAQEEEWRLWYLLCGFRKWWIFILFSLCTHLADENRNFSQGK